ncbi:hypothetical protein IFM89_022479 [Coptis chinensis]|uniref:DUF4218 domain-containing protein n=1 Tax=Coptis chinensis TaxID=261450 RepID=A0A835M3N5_9MAGN|nr:hypothetical protein IFM89_022479 [Coptis chinensis]
MATHGRGTLLVFGFGCERIGWVDGEMKGVDRDVHNVATMWLYVTNQTFVEGCIQEQYLVEEAMMYCMEYIHDGNLGSHKNGRRVIMNEDIERAHPMDKKGKQYVLPNIEYQQVRKWVLTHSLENAEWEEKYQVYLQSQKSRGKNRRGSQANELDYIPWLRLQLQNENVSPFKRIVDGPSFTAVSYNRYTANGTSANDSSSTTLIEDALEVADYWI